MRFRERTERKKGQKCRGNEATSFLAADDRDRHEQGPKHRLKKIDYFKGSWRQLGDFDILPIHYSGILLEVAVGFELALRDGSVVVLPTSNIQNGGHEGGEGVGGARRYFVTLHQYFG